MRSEDINHDRRHLGTVVMTGDENVELPRHAPNSQTTLVCTRATRRLRGQEQQRRRQLAL